MPRIKQLWGSQYHSFGTKKEGTYYCHFLGLIMVVNSVSPLKTLYEISGLPRFTYSYFLCLQNKRSGDIAISLTSCWLLIDGPPSAIGRAPDS